MSSVPDSPSRRAEQYDNRVLTTPPELSTAPLICSEPRWVNRLRRSLLVLSGGALAYTTLSAPTLPLLLALPLWIASALAMLVALWLSPAAIHFVSDSQGIYFPSRPSAGLRGPARPQTWLFVPWSNIAAIRVQLLLDESGSTKGVAFRVRASEQQRLYFAGAAIPGPDQRSPGGDAAVIDVCYPCAFRSPYKIAAALRCLQGAPGDEVHRSRELTPLGEH